MRKTVNLGDRIPIYSIENGKLLSKMQGISRGLKIEMPGAYSLSEQETGRYYELFNRIIKVLPAGYVLHKQDYYNRGYYRRDGGAGSFLSSAYERKFHGRMFFDHRGYLFITRSAQEDQVTNNVMTSLVTGRFIDREIHEGGLQEFNDTVRKVEHLIHGMKLKVTRLDDGELENLLNAYFNLGDSRVLKNITFKHDRVTVGEEELVIYNSVSSDIELPPGLNSSANVDEFFDNSFSFPLGIGLHVPHIVNTIVRKRGTNKVVYELGRKRDKILSMSFRSRGNTNLVKEYDAFLEAEINSGEHPVYFSQNIMLWGRGESLSNAENELNNALTKMDIYAQRNINCANVFWGCTPGNAADIPSSEFQIQFSNAASLYFPVETNPKGTGLNGIKVSERDFGIPVTLDMWDEPMRTGRIANRNMFILGPSGSGKSFFTNFMVRQYLEQGYHVTIIDVGGSYKRLCRLMNGHYFEYTRENKMSFNPFFVKEGVAVKPEERESLKTLIFTIWKGQDKEVTKEEYALLSEGLNKYYGYIKAEKIAANLNTFYEFMLGKYRESVNESESGFFNFQSFETVLKSYYEGGEYDFLLNSGANFSISGLEFCVFELDEIKDHKVIFPVVSLVIMDAFVAKMRRQKKVKKIILIEEAWKAISSGEMAGFLKYLYKTVRKFNGAVGVITQEIEDIVGNPVVKNTIVNNADVQILLDQTKYKNQFDKVANLLGLPAGEKKKIMSINKKPRHGDRFNDFYVRLGEDGAVFSTLVSNEEVATFTTEASQGLAIDKNIGETKDPQRGIQLYVEQNMGK